MARWHALLIFGLVLAAGLVRAEEAAAAEAGSSSEAEDEEDYAEPERAHLLVRKYFKEEEAVQGRNLTLHLELFNAGTSTATSVSVVDAGLPEGFKLLEGATTVSFAKIEVGSRAAHSYVVAATGAAGMVAFDPAKVTYKADTDGEEQTSASTFAYIEILTPAQKLQRHALEVGKYASLGFCRTGQDWLTAAALAAVVGALLGGNSAYKSITTARTNTARRKALASLEKDE